MDRNDNFKIIRAEYILLLCGNWSVWWRIFTFQP